MTTEFRVIISDNNGKVSTIQIYKALEKYGIDADYIEITAESEEDEDEDGYHEGDFDEYDFM
jgi:hypothetical protein